MRLEWDYAAFGELLAGPEMQGLMAEKIKAAEVAAKALAPVDDGEYLASFTTETGVRAGVDGTSRAYGTLRNTAGHAAAVEFGNRKTKAQHVLLRAIDAMRG